VGYGFNRGFCFAFKKINPTHSTILALGRNPHNHQEWSIGFPCWIYNLLVSILKVGYGFNREFCFAFKKK